MDLYVKGEKAYVGMEITTFRGEKMVLTGWREPLHGGSTGRVFVKEEGRDWTSEYYPSVIDAKFM